MIYLRGHKRDYDQWAEMGNVGWDWDSVLPHFKALENLQVPQLANSTQYGRDGFQSLSWYDSGKEKFRQGIYNSHSNILVGQPVKEAIKEGGRQLYYSSVLEEDSLNLLGYLESLMIIENGVRMNAAKAFLGKVKDRQNLHVALHSTATKIIIDETTKTAKGVEVKVGEKTLKLFANKEVILSGGVINSPQLLMLSGVGPKAHLDSLGIPVIADLPVGENLQDHTIFVGNLFTLDRDSVTQEAAVNEIYKYFMHRTGRLSEIFITNLVGFINTKGQVDRPNLQFIHVAFKPNDPYLFGEVLRSFNFEEVTAKSFWEADLDLVRMTIFPIVVNPKSRGRILLKSKDPMEKPVIYSGYFTDEEDEDLELTLEGIR